MFGFRYHVVTLCALFAMLGIGIMIGSVSGIGPALSKQQSLTIRSLNQKLDNVLSESEQDHALLRQHEDALSAIVPQLIAGKLEGKRIAIVRTGDYADAVTAAAAAISAAGGTVASTTTLTNRLQLLDETQRQKIAVDLKLSISGSVSSELAALLHPVAAILHAGDSTRPDLQTDLSTLEDDGVLDTSGDYSSPVAAVVIVGGSQSGSGDSGSSSIDEPLEAALLAQFAAYGPAPTGITIVGCEPYDADNSSMPTFAQAGIASVDCIDLPIGELDLPYALVGTDATAYGVKTTATRLVPQQLDAESASDTSPANTGRITTR